MSAKGKAAGVAGLLAVALLSMAVRPLASHADIITLEKADQPRMKRPVLGRIKASARRDGITLAQAIDRYAARNPRMTADTPDGPVTYPDILIDDLPLVELIDLRLAAKSLGMSYEQAIDRYAWQPRLNEIGERLLLTHPGELSGIALVEGATKVRIGFKNEVPDEAVTLARTLPVEVELQGRKGFSESELVEVMEEAHDSLRARPEIRQVQGRYDMDTGRITLGVRFNEETRKNMVADLRLPPPANPAITIKLESGIGAQMIPEDRYLRGGGHLKRPGDSRSGCTSGFNLVSVTSVTVRVAASARHCALSTLIYSNHSVQGDSTTISRAAVAANYDLARLTSGSMITTRTFYSDWQSSRYVDSVGTSPFRGQLICKFGISTGAGCSTVKSINEFIDDPDGRPVRGLVVMATRITERGDSGGPWYYGGTAWGFHQGTYSPNRLEPKTSAFTPAYLVPTALGAQWKIYRR
ncbi:hypothetical protein AB0L65_54080 [Nonomuraea sp. NPDC052116]|uniref:hypothetical protein n=1 Tax=Nonomuraea sp. NPDC052116 TaxID=3155665 RepID=UPI0034286F96